MKRVIFYFDGFNFYHGLKEKSEKNPEWKNYYWIDLVKFCEQFISEGSELKAVKYFTSPPMNEAKRSKQSALLGVNKLLNKERFLVCNGNYIHKSIDCNAQCKKVFKVLEEKRTDVNIAIEIIMDCVKDEVDTIVLITADSDQVTTIKTVKQSFKAKKIKVYFPPCRQSGDISNEINPVVYLENNENKFKAAVMPTVVTMLNKTYTKPPDWKPEK